MTKKPVPDGLRMPPGTIYVVRPNEAAVVEMYRQGQVSHGALAECLGNSRTDVDALRGGRARERNLAKEHLARLLNGITRCPES